MLQNLVTFGDILVTSKMTDP